VSGFPDIFKFGRVRVRDESGLRQKRLESVRVLRREERPDLTGACLSMPKTLRLGHW
jgi:hypothetical protein